MLAAKVADDVMQSPVPTIRIVPEETR